MFADNQVQEDQEMKYAVDIPNENEGGCWTTVEYFDTRDDAVNFCIRRYGADKTGNINLITEIDPE